jgi:hypothetical protein
MSLSADWSSPAGCPRNGASCPILYGVALRVFRRNECVAARDKALERLSKTNLPIIFVQKWDYYDDSRIDYGSEVEENPPSRTVTFKKLQIAIESTLEKFIAQGHRILLVGDQVYASCAINRPRLLQGPIPHAPQPPCPAKTREEAEQSTASIDQMLSRIKAKWPDKVELLRPVDYFCDRECPSVRDGVWLYFDYAHFTVEGSKYIVGRAAGAFRKFLENEALHNAGRCF